jgi:hypothetical protein
MFDPAGTLLIDWHRDFGEWRDLAVLGLLKMHEELPEEFVEDRKKIQRMIEYLRGWE